MGKNDSARGNEILYPVQNDEILYRSVRGEEGKEYTTKTELGQSFTRPANTSANVNSHGWALHSVNSPTPCTKDRVYRIQDKQTVEI